MSQESHHDDIIPNGGQIVERFGGIRPMASKLNVPVTTVQGWKKRDAIPAIRRDEILNAAERWDVNLVGLAVESANENNSPSVSSRGGIAEDPALVRSIPMPDSILMGNPMSRPQSSYSQPQAAAAPRKPVMQQASQPTPQPASASKNENFGNVDMKSVRKSARRTSFVTSTCVAAILVAGGILLFGKQGPNVTSAHINSLETRVGALEQRSAAAPNADTGAMQEQINNITAVIGTSAQGLAQMAREVAAGTNAPLTQRLAVLEAQIKASAGTAAPAISGMVDKMQSMATTPQGKAEWQSAIEDLRSTVNSLQGRTDQLDSALTEAKSQNDALGRTLSEVSGNDLGAAAMLLALTNLREAVDRQAPFEQDLALLKQVSTADNPELASSIDKLAPYAQSGVMSPSGLKRELQASANDIITAKLRGEDVSIKDKIMGRLQNLFSIRKNGESTGTGTEHDLIQTASRQLDVGDVAGAMATLQQLQGPAAEAAQPWQTKAQATMVAQNVDSDLVNAIVTKVKNGMNSMTSMSSGGVTVNSGPINMGAPMPTQAMPAMPAPESPAQTPVPSITQVPAPQTTAPMEPQQAPSASAPATVLPQTEPQAGSSIPMNDAVPSMPAPADNPVPPVIIQQ